MGLLRWFLRCTPGLSVVSLLILLESALRIIEIEWFSSFYPLFLVPIASPALAQFLFIAYSVFLHTLALLFPLRLSASTWAATRDIRALHGQSKPASSNAQPLEDLRNVLLERNPAQNALTKSSSVKMAVVLPSYKEDIEILESSLRVLASHTLARSTYDVRDVCAEWTMRI